MPFKKKKKKNLHINDNKGEKNEIFIYANETK